MGRYCNHSEITLFWAFLRQQAWEMECLALGRTNALHIRGVCNVLELCKVPGSSSIDSKVSPCSLFVFGWIFLMHIISQL